MYINRKPDALSHEKTRSISFRLPEDLVEEIETAAQLNNVSANVLVHRILERYTSWDSTATKAGFIPVTKGLIRELLDKVSDKEIAEIAKRVEKKEFEDIMLLFRSQFDIASVLDVIELRAKVSGFPYRYNVTGKMHSFVIQHDLGEKWSKYLASRYKEVFEDLGLTSMKFHAAPNTIQFDLLVEKTETNPTK